MNYSSNSGVGATFSVPTVVKNSGTVRLGSACEITSSAAGTGGVTTINATSDLVYGIVVGIVTSKGLPLTDAPSSQYDGTYTASTGTYVASASNETGSKVMAVVEMDQEGTIATKFTGTYSAANDNPGTYYSIKTATPTQIDIDTRSATVLQFQLIGFQPPATGTTPTIALVRAVTRSDSQ